MKALLLCLLSTLTIFTNGGGLRLGNLNQAETRQETKAKQSYQYMFFLNADFNFWINGTWAIEVSFGSDTYSWAWPKDKFKSWADFAKHIHKFYFINNDYRFYIWTQYDQSNYYVNYLFINGNGLAKATFWNPLVYRLAVVHYNGGIFGAHQDAWIDINIWHEGNNMDIWFTGRIWSEFATQGIHYICQINGIGFNLDS